MQVRTWIGLTIAVLAPVPSAGAQVSPQASRSMRQAAEVAAAQALALQEVMAAQVMSTHGTALATAEIQMAIDQARLATGFGHAFAADQAKLAMEQARMSIELAAPQIQAAQAMAAGMADGFTIAWGGPSWADRLDALRPEFRTLPQDPADSLYRAGRERLNSKDWQRAAEIFRRLRTEDRFARSGYRPDAFYWEAFALAQRGGEEDLRRARDVLRQMQAAYREGALVRDANTLAATIDGRLARSGDTQAAESLYRLAELEATRSAGRSEFGARAGRASRNPQCPQDEEDDIRIAALSALLNVDSDRTLPVLREVMQRRDECSVPLRRRALMLLARSRDPEAASVLLEVARNDPDESVREQAVLFLGTIRSTEARSALQSMLRDSDDVEVQRRALMALTQQGGEEASAMLRDYAARDNVSPELRRQAILLLVHRRSGSDENRPFLRDLFGRTTDDETRAAILHAMSADRSAEGVEWLMNVALNEQLPVDLRRQALFIAGQTEHVSIDRLVRLYDQATDAEMKEHLLFTLARRSEPAAFDKLVSIARTDSDMEVRRKAVFWLGQSKDPRAPEVLLEIIR